MLYRRSRRGASYLNGPAGSRAGDGEHFPRPWRALLSLIPILAISGDVGAAESPQSWRERFLAADRSLRDGGQVDYADLRAYPLYPYLRFRDLSKRLAEFPAAEIREFLETQADTPLAGQLRDTWLRQLARAGRWDDYLRDALPSRDPTFDCWRRQALLKAGQDEPALRDFAALWLRGTSLPAACDPVIAHWRSKSGPSPDLLWRRFALAIAQRNLGLAKALRAELPAADHPLADAWLAAADDPRLLLESARVSGDDPRAATMIGEVLKSWGKRDALAAAAALDALKERHRSFAPQWAEVERLLALWLASDYRPTALARLTALPEAVADGAVREWRVRICLRQGDWQAALRWLDRLSAAERDSPRWRYWRGRTLESLGRIEEARQVYRSIAGQRDYHGFLAADRIGAPYAIESAPLTVPAAELDALLAGFPGLRRAQELYILGREPEAEAEWRRVTQAFDPPASRRAALLAHRWAWHAQAIATVARAEHWDDLELRFPLAYRDEVVNNARASALDPAWVYAVIRQESGFRPAARSPVGALGLMQIMPATGQELAKEAPDLTGDTPDLLLRPETNLRLGARYLQKVLERLQGNPVLATAAYNAGPSKVARWLPVGAALPADLWAETIPYQETRSYVQRVLEYAAIYARRLGSSESPPLLESRMKPVRPAEPAPPSSG
jgi:soluble lytic murein transglycosylase